MGLNLLAAVALVPLYWIVAGWHGCPGLRYRLRCLGLGLTLLVRPSGLSPGGHALRLILMPMDSTRYFEFDYAQRTMASLPVHRYLDVSSPRQVPVLFARQRPDIAVDMINPDARDLADTRRLVAAARLDERCRLHNTLVTEAPFEDEAFDLITCISVLEHIPDDSAALRRMWSMLRRGGTLVLTVPCMARAQEQYIDDNEYGLLSPDGEGFVFWQRYYDASSLRDRIFSVVGEPADVEVFGESIRGCFANNAEQKRRLGPAYPFWREPYMMATQYSRFRTVDELPGEGVVGLTFVRR